VNEVNISDLNNGFIEGPVYWLVVTSFPTGTVLAKPMDGNALFRMTGGGAEQLPLLCPYNRKTGAFRPWRRVQLLQVTGAAAIGGVVRYGEHPDDVPPFAPPRGMLSVEGVAYQGQFREIGAQYQASDPLVAGAAVNSNAYGLRINKYGNLRVTDIGEVSSPAIYDVTSGFNTALDTGILDVSAWRQLWFWFLCSAGTSSINVQAVDDAGVNFAQIIGPAAAANQQNAAGTGIGPVASTALATVYPAPLPRRIRTLQAAAGVGNTVRLRIEGRR
jgi:hypothetical protein